jgi:hypothetical protein
MNHFDVHIVDNELVSEDYSNFLSDVRTGEYNHL